MNVSKTKTKLPKGFKPNIYYLVVNDKKQPLFWEKDGKGAIYLTEKFAKQYIAREKKAGRINREIVPIKIVRIEKNDSTDDLESGNGLIWGS